MASSSGSSYTSSLETTNYARICRIVVDVLRDILWQVLTHEILPADLPKKVQTDIKKLGKLYKEIKTWLLGISPPSTEIPSAEKFDVTSLYTLIRHLCSQVQRPTNNWGKIIPAGGITLGDDIERVRQFRNTLYGHATQAKIENADFIKLCIDIKNIVSRFDAYFFSLSKAMKCDFQCEIDTILTCCMDKSLEEYYIDKMKQIDILLDELGDQVDDVKQQVGDVKQQVGDVIQQVGDVKQQVGDVKQQVGDVIQQVGDVKQQVGDVKQQVGDVKQQVGDVKQQVGDVKQQVGDVIQQVGDVKQQVGDVKQQVGDVKQQVGDVKQQVGDVKQQVGDVKQQVGDVKQQADDIEKNLESVKKELELAQDTANAVQKACGVPKYSSATPIHQSRASNAVLEGTRDKYNNTSNLISSMSSVSLQGTEYVLKAHFDACIIYCQDDEDDAYIFKDHIEKLDLGLGEHPKICLYTEEKLWGPIKLTERVKVVCKHCTLIFVYLSKRCSLDEYADFFQNEAIIATIKNCRVRPVLSEKDCIIPCGLYNAPKIELYKKESRLYKENILSLFVTHKPERLRREEERIESILSTV